MRLVKTHAAIALMCLSLAIPVHAQSDDEDEAPKALNFGDLEYAMPRNPMLWTNTPLWAEQRTPRRQLMPALESLKTAVPVGTAAENAAETLHKAGAHCQVTSATEMNCRYRDSETPWPDYFDSIVWNVKLSLTDGKVSDIDVTRKWYRHS